MRSKRVIEKKLELKEEFLKSVDPEISSHEFEYQKGYIDALFWVLKIEP